MTFISTYDKQQALNRIVERARDLGLEDELDKINVVINSNGFSECFNPAIDVIKPWQKIESCPGAVGIPLKTLLDNGSIEKARKDGAKLWIRNNKYLVLQVDLSRKKADIVREFETLITLAGRHVTVNTQFFKETRGTEKSFQYSIWHVYDMCSQKKRPNFTEVARRLSGQAGQARDSDTLAASLKAVKRAYKRATEIIQEVEKTISKRVDA